MAAEPVTMAYFINPLSPLHYSIIAWQRLDKNVTAAINTLASMEVLLNPSF
jgi:hypothetical protein